MNVTVFVVLVVLILCNVQSQTDLEKWFMKQAAFGRMVPANPALNHVKFTPEHVKSGIGMFRILGYEYLWHRDVNGPVKVKVNFNVEKIVDKPKNQPNAPVESVKYLFTIPRDQNKVDAFKKEYEDMKVKYQSERNRLQNQDLSQTSDKEWEALNKMEEKMEDMEVFIDKLNDSNQEDYSTAIWVVENQNKDRKMSNGYILPAKWISITTNPETRVSGKMLVDLLTYLAYYEFKCVSVIAEDAATFYVKDKGTGEWLGMNAMTYRTISNKQAKIGNGPAFFAPSMYQQFGFEFVDEKDVSKCVKLRDAFAQLQYAGVEKEYKRTSRWINHFQKIMKKKEGVDIIAHNKGSVKGILVWLYNHRYYLGYKEILKSLRHADYNKFGTLDELPYHRIDNPNRMELVFAKAKQKGLYPDPVGNQQGVQLNENNNLLRMINYEQPDQADLKAGNAQQQQQQPQGQGNVVNNGAAKPNVPQAQGQQQPQGQNAQVSGNNNAAKKVQPQGQQVQQKANDAMQEFDNEYDEYYDESERLARIYKQYLKWKQGRVHKKHNLWANY